MKNVASIFALLIVVFCLPTSADGGHWIAYTIVDGLAGGNVHAMVQDKKGNLWIATDGDGVSRFDGESFRNFTTADGLVSNFVRAIFLDSKGNLWFATWGAGVCKYDGADFGTVLEVTDGLASNFVTSIIEDREGNLWFGTWGEGISKYDGETFENFTVERGLVHNTVRVIMEDRTGNLWFGTYGGGVSRYDGQRFTNFTTEDGLAHNYVKSILEDRAGNLWFGTRGGGAFRYDGKEFVNFTTENGLASSTVNTIYEDTDGNLWFGTHEGVSRYDGRRFENFTSTDGLVGDDVASIIGDREGNLWFGTWGGGICKYNDDIKHYLEDQTITSALEDRNGFLWFATWGNGIFRYDGGRFQRFTRKEGLISDEVSTIVEDRDGNLWFGGLGGMTKYNGETFEPIKDAGLDNMRVGQIFEDREGILWFDVAQKEAEKRWYTIKIGRYNRQSFHYFPVEADSQSMSTVSDILEDRAGNIWFGTSSNGVYRYDGNRLVHLTMADGLAGNRVSSIAEDTAGNIWFSIRGNDRPEPDFKGFGGLSAYNGTGFQTFSAQDGLGSDSVTGILKDRHGNLWFGTWHGGVSFYDGGFQTFTTKDGLASNTVQSMVEDQEGNIWFSSQSAGVSQYDGKTFQTLTTADGLLNNTAFITLADKRGDIWFHYWGTPPGVTRYTPSKDIKPHVSITQVVADKTYPATDEVKVPSKTHVAFHYKGLSLKTQFHNIRYICQLEGYDENWGPSTRGREAAYEQLKPGTYVFKVRAIDRDLSYSLPARVTLTVVRPFYRRAVFLVPTIGGGALMLIMLVIQAVVLVKRRRQVLQYQQAAVAEVREARQMQISLLPKSNPNLEGFDIAGICQPATDVGGDYFTYLFLDSARTQLGIVLMDVTGHGMKAATTTFLANGMLQSEIRHTQSPSEILAKMNQSLKEILPKRSFVATAFAQINLRDKTWMHFNAGIPEPILLRDGKPVELQIQSTVPLGCPLRAEYIGTSMPLREGDVLLLFSDGLPEAMNVDEQMYEKERLWKLLETLSPQGDSAAAWVEAIESDIRAFITPHELLDDLTVVVVRLL